MDELIEALNIFKKYLVNDKYHMSYPTHCEHDVLIVGGVSEDAPTEEDRIRLEQLGFNWDYEYDSWSSTKFGSC